MRSQASPLVVLSLVLLVWVIVQLLTCYHLPRDHIAGDDFLKGVVDVADQPLLEEDGKSEEEGLLTVSPLRSPPDLKVEGHAPAQEDGDQHFSMNKVHSTRLDVAHHDQQEKQEEDDRDQQQEQQQEEGDKQHQEQQEEDEQEQQQEQEEGEQKAQYVVVSERVIIIVPFIGNSLPVWFNTFLFYVQFGSELIDWYIFITDEDLALMKTPENVFLEFLSSDELYDRLLTVDSRYLIASDDDKQEWRSKLSNCIDQFPHIIVEFKPCLGYMFQDYIRGYSHWGYADVDVLLGRTSSFLTSEILRTFDIYTSSFGDVPRLYLRGQFSVFHNVDKLIHLWKKCHYFAHFLDRVTRCQQERKWIFQSAEGCISHIALVGQTNISTFIASSQVSDAFRAPVRDKEAFFLGNTLMRCYESSVVANMSEGQKYDLIITS